MGRYGPGASDFDYTPITIRRSVRRSLQRLHTQYLDVVYLHDVEFVAPCIAPRAEGNHASALGAEAVAYGLASEQDVSNDGEGEGGSTGSTVAVRTPGDDERILEAISELRALQADGLIRQVGIAGPSVSRLPSPSHPLTQINRSTPTSSPPHRDPRPKSHRSSPRHSPNLLAPNPSKLHPPALRTSLPHARTHTPRRSRLPARQWPARAFTNRPTRMAPSARSTA